MNEMPQSPFAKYHGSLMLGENEVDCYVSDTGQRLISMRSVVKAIAGVDSGKLDDYVGINALQPYINNMGELKKRFTAKFIKTKSYFDEDNRVEVKNDNYDELTAGENKGVKHQKASNIKGSVAGENKSYDFKKFIELSLPGNPQKAKCLISSQFLDLCTAYVAALNDNVLTTDRQKEIAIKCSFLLSACAKVGLDALIDEATGYQHIRREDELQLKLKLYIADELREWEKTFPDELWEQFGRLTNWSTPLKNRPRWWGKLVIELVYNTLDPDVAEYLKNNKPEPGVYWHQQLTSNIGIRQLVSRCHEVIGIAKTCDNIDELRGKVGYHYHQRPYQMMYKFE